MGIAGIKKKKKIKKQQLLGQVDNYQQRSIF